MNAGKLIAGTIVLLVLSSFFQNEKKPVDLMIRPARIYAVDSKFTVAEAMDIRDGKIVAKGTEKQLMVDYNPAQIAYADNNFIDLGLIDARLLFFGYAYGLQSEDFTGTRPPICTRHRQGWGHNGCNMRMRIKAS